MNDFDVNGFLGAQASSIRNTFIERYKELFAFAEDLNRFSISLTSQAGYFPFQKCPKDLVVGSLFCKCITSYQSTILILSYGLPNEAEVLLRSLMESTFILHACCNEEDYYKDYLKSHEYQRLYLATNILSNDIPINLTPSFSEKEITGVENKYKQAQKYKLNFREIAKKAGLKHYYFTQYWNLSLSVHNSPRSIEHYIHLDENKKPSFKIIPKVDDDAVKTIIILSSDLILKILEKLHNYYELKFNKNIKAFYDRLKLLGPS